MWASDEFASPNTSLLLHLFPSMSVRETDINNSTAQDHFTVGLLHIISQSSCSIAPDLVNAKQPSIWAKHEQFAGGLHVMGPRRRHLSASTYCTRILKEVAVEACLIVRAGTGDDRYHNTRPILVGLRRGLASNVMITCSLASFVESKCALM